MADQADQALGNGHCLSSDPVEAIGMDILDEPDRDGQVSSLLDHDHMKHDKSLVLAQLAG